MRKLRWTAFRRFPGRSCGHTHMTKRAAEKCMRSQQKRHGGKWHVSSAYYSQ